MTPMLELSLNALLALLLVVTISYCWVLNRRIRVLQDSRSELADLLQHFDASTQRASDSIAALQSTSKKIGETIQNRIDVANHAIEDLTFLVERANQTADAMEAGIAISRQKEKMSRKIETDFVAEETQTSKALESLQVMLERVSHRASSDPSLRGTQKTPRHGVPSKPLSQAEQELLDVLKPGSKV